MIVGPTPSLNFVSDDADVCGVDEAGRGPLAGPVVAAANQEDIQLFMRVAREQMAGNTLRRHAAQLVAAGTTTVEEAMRISNQFEE